MSFPGRNMEASRMHLRMRFYGGVLEGSSWGPVNVACCYRKAEVEINKWIAKDINKVEGGLHGTIGDLKGW
jgi:hypothetical protein